MLRVVVLQHVADPFGILGQRPPVQEHFAAFRLHEAVNQGEKRGFAAAGGTDHGDEFPSGQGK